MKIIELLHFPNLHVSWASLILIGQFKQQQKIIFQFSNFWLYVVIKQHGSNFKTSKLLQGYKDRPMDANSKLFLLSRLSMEDYYFY